MKYLIVAALLIAPLITSQTASAGDGRDRALPDQYECPGCGGWAKYRADLAAQQGAQQQDTDRLERLQQRQQELIEQQEEQNRRLERQNRRLEERNERRDGRDYGRDYDRGYGRDSYRDYDSRY